MEAAICTRCQSANPLFTKFCLICGLELTAQMKRLIPPPGSKPATNATVALKEEPEPVVSASVQSPPVEPKTPPPKKESTRWLKGLRRLGRS